MKRQSNKEHNAQYKKNHIRIIEGILKLMRHFRVNITCAQIARETGLARRTIRNHGADRNKLIDEAEAVLLGQFLYRTGRIVITEKDRKTPRKVNKRYFTNALLFISKRKRFFAVICADENNRELLRKMMAVLYDKLMITWTPVSESAPLADSEKGKMFIAMAVEILCQWGQETGCRIEQSDVCLRKLLLLAEEASLRCKL